MKYILILIYLILSISFASAEVKDFIFLEAPLFTTEHEGRKIRVLFTASSFIHETNGVKVNEIKCCIESSITFENITNSRYINLNKINENIVITNNIDGVDKIIISGFLNFKRDGERWILEYKKLDGKIFLVRDIKNEKIKFLLQKIENIKKNKDNYTKLWSQQTDLWMSGN